MAGKLESRSHTRQKEGSDKFPAFLLDYKGPIFVYGKRVLFDGSWRVIGNTIALLSSGLMTEETYILFLKVGYEEDTERIPLRFGNHEEQYMLTEYKKVEREWSLYYNRWKEERRSVTGGCFERIEASICLHVSFVLTVSNIRLTTRDSISPQYHQHCGRGIRGNRGCAVIR